MNNKNKIKCRAKLIIVLPCVKTTHHFFFQGFLYSAVNVKKDYVKRQDTITTNVPVAQ